MRYTQFPLLCLCGFLAAPLACGDSATGSNGDEDTGTGETGDGDGDPPSARTLVAIQQPSDRIEIIAVDFDAAEPTPIPVTDLGPGSRVGYAQWFAGHGQVLQAGESEAPAPAKLVRFEDGEFIATLITPASTKGRIHQLELASDGSGALIKLSSSYDLVPDPDWPGECSLVWVSYDEARTPQTVTTLEDPKVDCSFDQPLPELALDPAGELAAWLVVDDDEVMLRAVELDGGPGPVQTLAVAPKGPFNYGLFVDADKLGATLDLDDDGQDELVVYDRNDLDAPPAIYPFAGPSQYASWSDDGDWVVWRVLPTSDLMFMAFDGLVPSTPALLAGPEVAGGFGERLTSEGKIRFVYAAPNPDPNAEPIERRGLAEVEIGPEGPGAATPITPALADDEQVWIVTHREDGRASAYEIQSVPPDQGTIAIAVVDTGPSPFAERVFEVSADAKAYVSWAPGEARRMLVIEMEPEHRISVVDLDAPDPWGELVAEGSVGPLAIRGAGWSASGEHVLLHVWDEDDLSVPHALARVPASGGEPELVLSVEEAYIDRWWTVYPQ